MQKAKWKQINWKQAETYINRLQIRIVKAMQENKWRLVRRLQYLITHSFFGKALAVKRMISNKGKNTPGIDEKVWKTDKENLDALITLQINGYRASALRRIYIEKFGKKEKRRLGISTMKDRAMQSVQLLGLEPVAEALADTVPFGFRKYKGTQYAMEYGFSILCRKDPPQWILEGDIKGCFDNISHKWLKENIPTDVKILKQFMKCGYVYDKELYPTTNGTPQGGSISPTLANMMLDGMESQTDNGKKKKLKKKLSEYLKRGKVIARPLADTIKRVKEIVRRWINYFRIGMMKQFMEEFVEWLGHKIRVIVMKQWKNPKTIYRNLYYLNMKNKNGFYHEEIYKVANLRLG